MCTVKDWAALLTSVLWPAVVLLAVLLFRVNIRSLLTRVRGAKAFGIELTAEAEETKAAIAQTPTDNSFDKISYLLDWNKFSAEVHQWAQRNDAADPANMGPNNFARMLYEYGLPGGKPVELRWRNEGGRRVLEYQ
jgi:hypothetical protein